MFEKRYSRVDAVTDFQKLVERKIMVNKVRAVIYMQLQLDESEDDVNTMAILVRKYIRIPQVYEQFMPFL